MLLLFCLVSNCTHTITVYEPQASTAYNWTHRRAARPTRTYRPQCWHYTRLPPLLYYLHVPVILFTTCNTPLHDMHIQTIGRPIHSSAGILGQPPAMDHTTWRIHDSVVTLINDIFHEFWMSWIRLLTGNDVHPNLGP